jgi:hypothetical protein
MSKKRPLAGIRHEWFLSPVTKIIRGNRYQYYLCVHCNRVKSEKVKPSETEARLTSKQPL